MEKLVIAGICVSFILILIILLIILHKKREEDSPYNHGIPSPPYQVHGRIY
jgi:hypothetical protein